MIQQINPDIKKVDCIVYTRDRACQVDLLLRSMSEKFLNAGKVYIVYTYSDDNFKAGYDRLLQEKYNLDCVFIKQTSFQQNVLGTISMMSTPYFLGLCDDDVFIRETDCTAILGKLDEEGVSSISIKHGLDINHSYPDNRLDPNPEFLEQEVFLKWNWRTYVEYSAWGYPTCVNSYIYLREYFLKLLEGSVFNFPPDMEGCLNTKKEQFKESIVSFRELKLLNLPVNRIQTHSLCNPFAVKFAYGIEYLNRKFLNGDRISTANIYTHQPNQSNDELELHFERL